MSPRNGAHLVAGLMDPERSYARPMRRTASAVARNASASKMAQARAAHQSPPKFRSWTCPRPVVPKNDRPPRQEGRASKGKFGEPADGRGLKVVIFH
eukprot:s861_g22.t1